MPHNYLPEELRLFYGSNCKIGPGVARTAYAAGPPPGGGCLACHLTKEYDEEFDPVCSICYACKNFKKTMPNLILSRERNLLAAQDGSETEAMRLLAKGTFIRLLEQGDWQSPDHIRNTADMVVDRELEMVGTFTKTYRLGEPWLEALEYFMRRTGGPMVFSCSTPWDIDMARTMQAIPAIVISKEDKHNYCKWPPVPVKPLSQYLEPTIVFPCPNQVEKMMYYDSSYYCSSCRLCAAPHSKKLYNIIKASRYEIIFGLLEH